MSQLTSLAAVKTWLIGNTESASSVKDDVLLTSLIKQVSQGILNYIQRPAFIRTTFTELQSGVGNTRIMLRNYPVLNVSALSVNNATITPRLQIGSAGYALSTWDGTISGNPQEVTLCGSCFSRGQNNISITYQAGYCVQNEAQSVGFNTEIYTITPLQPYGTWSQDDGVTYASSGQALVKVASSPTVGQYTVSDTGLYTFNSSDNTVAMLLNYSYIPAAVELACIEWVGERYRYKSRIGQKTQSLNGQTTASYDLSAMPGFIAALLEPYKKWLPL